MVLFVRYGSIQPFELFRQIRFHLAAISTIVVFWYSLLLALRRDGCIAIVHGDVDIVLLRCSAVVAEPEWHPKAMLT